MIKSSEYLNALNSLGKYSSSYTLDECVLCCMEHPCMGSGVAGAENAYNYARNTINDIIRNEIEDSENNLVKRIRIYICLFEPKKESFNTYLMILRQLLDQIKISGCKEEYKKSFSDNCSELLTELQNIREEVNADYTMGLYNNFGSANSSMPYYCSNLLVKRTECIRNKCGVFGPVNPAIGIMNQTQNFRDLCTTLNDINQELKSFCQTVIDKLNQVMSQTQELKDSNPCLDTEQKIARVDEIASGWNSLIAMIDTDKIRKELQ